MTLSAHRLLFSLIVLAALVGFGWLLVVYVVSFHAAQWVIDKIDPGYAPRPVRLHPQRRVAAQRFRRLSAR